MGEEKELKQQLKQNFIKKEPIDLEDITDRNKLQIRCMTLWMELVDGTLKSKHKVLYHRCCVSFSKSKAAKTTNHPTEETSSLSHLIEDHQMQGAGDLAEFIMKELTNKPIHLRVLPRLNYVHQSDVEMLEVTRECREENAKLGKRLREAEDKIRELETKIRELEKQNNQKEEDIWRLHRPQVIEITSKNKPTHQRRRTLGSTKRERNRRIPILSLVSPARESKCLDD